MPLSAPVHRTIVVVDVADFTKPARTAQHQIAVHDGLYQVLTKAFADTGIDLGYCDVEDRGDGVLILVPPDVSKAHLADVLPERLVAELRRYNASRTAEASIQLRVGLHAGEVRQSSNGPVSTAVNFAYRILDASAAKTALRESSGIIAFIASDSFYREVISPDPATDPAAYQRIPVAVKEVSTEAWLRLSATQSAQVASPHSYENLLPPLYVEELSWLSEVNVPNLPTLVRRAAGPMAPILHGTAWDVFVHLSDFNAGPDGLPPALLFLDQLADQVGGAVGDKVSTWVEHEVRRLRLEPALRARRLTRTPLPDQPRVHLLIAIEPDGIDPQRCRLSHWRQDDPDEWPPARGAIREVHLSDLEHEVAELVVETETAWRDQEATAAIEFLLPRALLHLPVQQWVTGHETGEPRALRLDYPIVLRSLERMRAQHWHRVWRNRWRSMVEDPSSDRVYFGQSADLEEPYRMDAILTDPRWVSMVLAEAPQPHPHHYADGLTAGLRAGLPMVLWHPDASPDSLRELTYQLTEGADLVNLPERARHLALSPPSFDVDLAKDLVVMWDDPRRTVVLD